MRSLYFNYFNFLPNKHTLLSCWSGWNFVLKYVITYLILVRFIILVILQYSRIGKVTKKQNHVNAAWPGRRHPARYFFLQVPSIAAPLLAVVLTSYFWSPLISCSIFLVHWQLNKWKLNRRSLYIFADLLCKYKFVSI